MLRDLDELAAQGLLVVINPGGKPQRYRQAGKQLLQEEADWQYLLGHLRNQIHGLLPHG